MSKAETSLAMNNGRQLPSIGFGLWQVKNKQECIKAIEHALVADYRHFDTAQVYGNESYLGEALSNAKIPREDVFITTKIWNENQYWDDLPDSFEGSLKNLRTSYVDLLLLHFPVTETRRPAWRRMEELYGSGRAKSIGVSNYTIRHLEELLAENKIVPAVNQVELHVFLQQPELVEFCRSHNIVVEAYSPLAHGEGLNNPVLAEIAKKHRKSPAQIMIRWCLEVGTVPLPKSVTPERIAANIDVFDFVLGSDDMAKLRNLDSGLRTCWDPTNTP